MIKEGNSWILKDWTVYPKLNLIQNHQSEFSVKPRLMKLLEFFLLNQQQVVTKEAILEYVWKDRIVTENLLTKSISELRKLLEQHFGEQVEIETIRNVGYRFTTQFEVFPDANTAPGMVKPNPKTKKSTLRSFAFYGGITLLILISTSVFITQQSSRKYETRTSQISSLKGQELSPVISPDGQNIAFAWRQNTSALFHIYVRPLTGNNPRKLSHSTAHEFNPIWSPDGHFIFFMRREKGAKLNLIKKSAIGDDEVKVIDLSGLIVERGMIWTSDKQSLLFSARKKGDQPYALFAFDIKAARLKQLTQPTANSYGDIHPSLSGQNHQIAFVRSNGGKSILSNNAVSNSTIQLLDLSSLKTNSIVAIKEEIKDLVYHPDLQQQLCWVSHELGNNELLGIDQEGTISPLYKARRGLPGKGAIGTNGIFYFEYWQSNLNVHQYHLESPSILRDSSTEYLNSTQWDWGLSFASASEEMAFISNRSGHQEIWLSTSDAPENAHQVTDLKLPLIKSISTSPDGKQLLFLSVEKGQSAIYHIQSNGQQLQRLSEDGVEYSAPQWSANGEWIFYGSNKSGVWQIWKMDWERTANQPISDAGGHTVFVAPDDEAHLFYANFNQDSIYQLSLSDGQTELIVAAGGIDVGNWRPANQGLYFLAWEDGACQLRYYDRKTRELHTLQVVKDILPGIPSLALSRDGASVFVAQSDGISADLLGLEIW